MDMVEDIDKDARLVITGSRRISYDYLVIATGARHACFGSDDWEAWRQAQDHWGCDRDPRPGSHGL